MGERLRATGTPEKDVEPLAELLAEDLAEWPDDAWLAFDDYQFACESPFAEEFVERVLALCPLKLFLTSRKRPSWATSRRLLYGDVYEIGRSLLAMSQEEAEQVLADRRSSEAKASSLWQTDGRLSSAWRRLTEEIELPDDGLPEALYDYFAEELYQAADPELRWSLCRLSLSSSVAPAVAEAVLGDEAERALVEGIGSASSCRQSKASSRSTRCYGLPRGEVPGARGRSARPRSSSSSCKPTSAARNGTTRSRSSSASSTESCSYEVVETALPQVLLEARLPTLARWVECATEHEVDAPVFDLADGELAFRAGDTDPLGGARTPGRAAV